MTYTSAVLQKGTFFYLTGPSNHLHIIINDPVFCPERGFEAVAAVNITSMTANHDPACILDVGCHPFIKHPSYVFYKDATVFSSTKLSTGIASGDISVDTPVTEELLKRVLDGFNTSKFVKPKIKRFLKNHAKVL